MEVRDHSRRDTASRTSSNHGRKAMLAAPRGTTAVAHLCIPLSLSCSQRVRQCRIVSCRVVSCRVMSPSLPSVAAFGSADTINHRRVLAVSLNSTLQHRAAAAAARSTHRDLYTHTHTHTRSTHTAAHMLSHIHLRTVTAPHPSRAISLPAQTSGSLRSHPFRCRCERTELTCHSATTT